MRGPFHKQCLEGLTRSRKLPCRKKVPRKPCTAVAAALRMLFGDGVLLPSLLLAQPCGGGCLVCDACARSAVAFERCSAKWLRSINMTCDHGLF